MTIEHCWHVYMVRCADGSLYTGVTTNPGRRVAEHNAGRGAKYTRSRAPVELVYSEPANDRSAAQRREHALRRLPPARKTRLVENWAQLPTAPPPQQT